MNLFTLRIVKAGAGSGNSPVGYSGRVFLLIACWTAATGCGIKTVYLHDGKQDLANVAVLVWSSLDPPADEPSIALAKIDDTRLEVRHAPVNRAEVLPGTHDFMVKASYPSPSALGAHKPPP